VPGSPRVPLRTPRRILMLASSKSSRPAMRIDTTMTKITAASLSLTTLLALGGCKAIQPKPQCKAQPADYAARYTVVSKSDPMCAELTGEVLHLQYYRPK